MAISKPPGFSSIVIALLYLIVAMDPNRQHGDEEHAAIATGALAKLGRTAHGRRDAAVRALP
ncbi:hypothetical protein ACE15N_19565 [Xanthomonas campestris pv. passiflorae]|uniref:hypothetical protein n=1 Tax=Xanthomonas campestris TaxID=339 RepID=UPI002442A51F|nr:hypothetical protein [Xanthomonas campestris]